MLSNYCRKTSTRRRLARACLVFSLFFHEIDLRARSMASADCRQRAAANDSRRCNGCGPASAVCGPLLPPEPTVLRVQHTQGGSRCPPAELRDVDVVAMIVSG